MTKEEVLQKLRENKNKIKEFGVKKIGIFGSFSKDTANEKSDIDIYVEFDLESITFDKYLALEEFLKNLLSKDVDIIIKEGLESIRIDYIKEDIKRGIIYALRR